MLDNFHPRTPSHHPLRKLVDTVEYNLSEEEQEDYQLEEFFQKTIRAQLHPLIEHRVKLVLKESTFIQQGESQVLNTTCILKSKMKIKHGKFATYSYKHMKNSPSVLNWRFKSIEIILEGLK